MGAAKSDNRKQKSSRSFAFLICLAAIVFSVIVGILLSRLKSSRDDISAISGDYGVAIDEDCESGPLKDAETLDDRSPGIFCYQLNTKPWFPGGDEPGTVCFQNEKGNSCLAVISYILDDGAKVYESGAIPPDAHIELARLDVPLIKGTYNATCEISLIDIGTLSKLNTLSEKIVIQVEE